MSLAFHLTAENGQVITHLCCALVKPTDCLGSSLSIWDTLIYISICKNSAAKKKNKHVLSLNISQSRSIMEIQ